MEWYLKVLRSYADFKGRARRQEFWMFMLFNFLFSCITAIADKLILGAYSYPLNTIYSLAVFIPTIAVLARRLHDTDRTGWWILIGLIPVVGYITLIVFACFDGNRGENRFGADPKAQGAHPTIIS